MARKRFLLRWVRPEVLQAIAHVALTQVAPRGPRLAASLQREAPDLDWRSLPSAVARSMLSRSKPPSLSATDWIVLTSPSTIEAVIDAWGASYLQGRNLLVVGPGSAQILESAGVDANIVAPTKPPYDARRAVDALMLEGLGTSCSVLVLGGESSKTPWSQWLSEIAATIQVEPAVRLEPCDWSEVETQWLRSCRTSGQPVGWMVTSSQAALWLTQRVGALGQEWLQWAQAQHAATIHPAIADSLKAGGWSRVDIVAPGSACLIQWARSLG